MFERHKYKELSKVDLEKVPDAVSSVKYDGANYFINMDEKGSPSFISRRPSVTDLQLDRTIKLPHLNDIVEPEFSGAVFNAELIHTGHDKNNIESHPASSGILNSLPARAIETQRVTGPIRAVLFDVIKPELKTYKDKIQYMEQFVKKVNKPDFLYLPEFKIGIDETKKLMQETESQGREGIIITSLTHPEESNTRIKLKHVSTWNLRIKRFIQERDKNGNLKASVGAAVVEDKTGREVAAVGGGWSKRQREDMFKNPKAYLNSLIQVRGMTPTANRIRSPQYNGDADGEIDEV